MNKTQEKLEDETEKWLDKLDKKIENKRKSNPDLEEIDQMENVIAYRDDTKHFLEQEDYIRAWEAVIYAWGIIETLERLEVLD